ncbi:hypothetical protein HPB52_023143 [Rhipicephalus sanguineus]|uniref:Endonuclease/exonuclease/phosphatase domain-containing protein n=1 Tax=Rhipicephalus sanguineus TaxID=34632 RepID=A0A9D4Q4C2_RHISA|nr:hypothetical protein HPB52_023143 [Rhipicephalus sanguineus]
MDLAGPSTSKAQGNMPTASQPEAFERTTSEDDWHTVLTLRQKKQQARAKKQGQKRPEEEKTKEAQPRPRRRKGVKLPPLPKDDFKIVIRPHQGLPLRSITTPEMAAAVTAACQHAVTGEHFLLRIKPGSNIAIISTSKQEVAERLRRITALTINGRTHAVNVYAATGEEALMRVIHGIPSRTPAETLMANLRVRTQGVEIIQARMMGETKSAKITFCGPTLPRFVYYCGGELACHPYRATVQVCKTCCSKGHRTDVCPQPDARVCRICGTRDPTDGHACVPKCASCGGEHVTGDRSCTQRLKQPRAPARQPRKRPSSPKRKELRWFSSDEEESELSDDGKPRSASRHSTPTRHDRNAARACSKSPPPRKPRSRSKSKKRTTNSPRRKAEESQTPITATAEPVGQQKQAPPAIVPRGHPKNIVANVYSSPRERKADFTPIISHAVNSATRGDRVILLGNFNAWHTEWGYKRDSAKGTSLLKATQAHDLILVTQPDSPTRLGNSVARDPAPDLCFVSDERGVTWTNLDETLGSDHYILSISIQTAKIRQPTGTARLTDWRKFRECQTDIQDLNTIKDWTTYLREAADQATKRIQTTPKNPAIDNHLLHLWEARRSLTKRWKKQRHNRKLRERIAQLTEAANAYSQELCTANWRSLCDSLRGNLSTKKTWALLRNMLTPANTRRKTTLALRRILNHYTGSDADFLRELPETYLGERPTRTTMTTYVGPANPAHDERISLAEVFGSTSIAFSEALDDREFGIETRVSGLGIRLILGPSEKGVCGPFEEEEVTTGPLCVGPEDI